MTGRDEGAAVPAQLPCTRLSETSLARPWNEIALPPQVAPVTRDDRPRSRRGHDTTADTNPRRPTCRVRGTAASKTWAQAPPQRRTGPRAQFGLTLIEMMIALLIGLVLTGGAIQIFASSHQAYRTNQALSRIQENGRYALQFLTKSIRGAGFWGCAQELEVNNVVVGGTNINFDGEATIGEDGGPGSPDSITLRMAKHNTGIGVVQQMPKVSANLFLSETDEIQEGDIMVVTDCVSADIFMVTNNNTNNDNLAHNSGVSIDSTENSTQKMSKSYGTDAVAYSVAQYTFEIVDNSLQRTTNGVVTETLVDGVVDLQLSYGVDTDNDETPNAYLDADEVEANAAYEWDEVLAVRIELLVRSKGDHLVASPQQQVWDFDGDGTLDEAPDGRMYHRFGATVGVRNRI